MSDEPMESADDAPEESPPQNNEAVPEPEVVANGEENAAAAAANGNDAENSADDDSNADEENEEQESEEDERSKSKKEMTQVIQKWEREHTQHLYDPVPTLRRLAEIFEEELEVYMRKDPDPLDMRHPYRADPSCQYGLLLKLLFRKDHFMNKLVNDYLRENFFTRQNVRKSSLELNIIACRLILDIMPGLETSAVFQADNDNLINRIYNWAEDSIDPLQSYATGLLAAALEVTDIAITYREQNTRLVPKMIKRLHMLQAIYKSGHDGTSLATTLSPGHTSLLNLSTEIGGGTLFGWANASAPQSPQHNGTLDSIGNNSNMSMILENSREAFPSGAAVRFYKRMYIPLHPPTSETYQMLIIRYLTSMGEYQEFLGMVFENNALQLIFNYLENLDRRDTCLAFEVLKYLSSLLCHKKFALEFITHGGLELLLKVPRPSLATTGVSITFYYLAYCEDAMERICAMPKSVITELVRYALWILGRSHDSGKCHATMFFSFSFQFKVILDEFDAQDGLRKLYNVISILKILNPSDRDSENNEQNDDVECASRQMVRHVCVALKRYMEAHFYFKYTSFLRQHCGTSSSGFNEAVAAKVPLDQLTEQIRMLQEHTSVRAHWEPVDNLLKLGGIHMLLKVITFCYDWNNGGRSETVRSALDVLSICCVIPRVYVALCDRLEMPDNTTTSGICSVLGAAAGDITTEAEVQKSALAVLCHCVCSPIVRKEPNNLMKCLTSSSKKSKVHHKYSEELIERIWESVCSSNGIIVLLSLMQTKAPLTDADCIRGMACRSLAGLARSERVRQIVGKLPLFASGQIQALMRDPILQEKRAEHVTFQRYALELIERISGKTKPINNPLDPSLLNMHKANVIAQTKIMYNDLQLFQLIHDHLESKGMSETAQMLQKEAGLQLQQPQTKSFHQSPFDYKVLPTPSRNRLRSRWQDVNTAINSFSNELPTTATNTNSNTNSCDDGPHCSFSGAAGINSSVTPIKIRKTEKHTTLVVPGSASSATQRSLQKQISATNAILNEGGIQDDHTVSPPSAAHKGITLNTIVTEYLTNQHALCRNPVTTCPQFDLFVPHKCPDPKPNRLASANLNLSVRHFRAQAGFNTARFDRRYVHSNFAPWRTIRSNDYLEYNEYNDIQFTSCAIVPNTKFVVVGTQQGEAKVFNINDGVEQFASVCHSYSIDRITAAANGEFVITSCLWRSPVSELWSIRENDFTSVWRFNDTGYCEFGKTSQDKIIGTHPDCAVLYDVNTGAGISTFTPTIPNQYTMNRATLCRTDELLLSDGVLWDVRSGREIHKFDKFNQAISGVFHPNCLEIISNTEIWDLRTFHLLQTVPVLDQRIVQFSPMNVIYGAIVDHENCPAFEESNTYDTSFNVLDAFDYSSISTIDVKRNIYDLSVSDNGSLIALVENQTKYDSKDETFLKIYAVGVKKSERRDEEDEEEEPESDDDGSDSGSENVFSLSPNFMGFPLRSRRRRNIIDLELLSDHSSDSDDQDSDDDDDDDDDDDSDDVNIIDVNVSSDDQDHNTDENNEDDSSE